MQLQFVYKLTLTFSLIKFSITLFYVGMIQAEQTAEQGEEEFEKPHPIEGVGIIYDSWDSDESRFSKTLEHSGLVHSRMFTSSHDVDFNDKAVTPFFPRPELIVFALEQTLWPYVILTDITPPFSKDEMGFIFDKYGENLVLCDDVPIIIKSLFEMGYEMAIASRSKCPDDALHLLDLLGIKTYFHYIIIDDVNKTYHFQKLHNQTGVNYKDMLYFETKYFEMYPIAKLYNVTSIFVLEGLTVTLLNRGLFLFSKCRGNGTRYKPPWLRYDKKFLTKYFKVPWPDPNPAVDNVLNRLNNSIPDYYSEETEKIYTIRDFREIFYSEYYQ